eukprot:scaffold10757_cov57-Attheya_sp.AAC.3
MLLLPQLASSAPSSELYYLVPCLDVTNLERIVLADNCRHFPSRYWHCSRIAWRMISLPSHFDDSFLSAQVSVSVEGRMLWVVRALQSTGACLDFEGPDSYPIQVSD